MSQTVIYNTQENILGWIDLLYADLANQMLIYHYYYVGEPISLFELLIAEGMYDLVTAGDIDECISCIIGARLNRYKLGYCEDTSLVESCPLE